jgi:hypothetical protein
MGSSKNLFFTEGNQGNKENGRENNGFKFIYFQWLLKIRPSVSVGFLRSLRCLLFSF